jgi:hypothetical protein
MLCDLYYRKTEYLCCPQMFISFFHFDWLCFPSAFAIEWKTKNIVSYIDYAGFFQDTLEHDFFSQQCYPVVNYLKKR